MTAVKLTRDALRAMDWDQLKALAVARQLGSPEPGQVKKADVINQILMYEKAVADGEKPAIGNSAAPAEPVKPLAQDEHPFFKPDDDVRVFGDMGVELGLGTIVTVTGHDAMVRLDGEDQVPKRFSTARLKHVTKTTDHLAIEPELHREIDPTKPPVIVPEPGKEKLVMPESSKKITTKGAKSQKTPKQQQLWKATGAVLPDGVKLPKQMQQIMDVLKGEKDGLQYHELLRTVDQVIKTKQGAKAVVGYYRSKFIELGLVKVS